MQKSEFSAGPVGIIALWITLLFCTLLLHNLPLLALSIVLLVTARILDGRFGRFINLLIFWSGALVILAALIMGPKQHSFAGIAYSLTGFWIGLEMSARCICIMVATRLCARRLSPLVLISFLQRLSPSLGLSACVALNMLGELTRHIRELSITFRQRRLSWFRYQDIRRFVFLLLSDILVSADQMVIAAQLRGIDRSAPPLPITVTVYDLILVACSASVFIGIVMYKLLG